MRGLKLAAVMAVSLGCSAVVAAWADEQLRPLAASGAWVAMAHQSSMTAAPDVCMAVNTNANVGLRADSDGVEFRIADNKWSLPAHVSGSIAITIGTWNTNVEIDANTDQSVEAIMPEDVLLAMFVAMDKATTMSVVVGKSKSRIVSLVGSSKATNAFRTCAGIHSSNEAAGENPFK